MLLTPIRLSAVFALASFLAVLLCTWDAILSVRLALAPASGVLLVCGILEYNVYIQLVRGREERAKWWPVLPVERVVEHTLPLALPPVPSLNTGVTPRSIVLNANGESSKLELAPEPDASAVRVRHMLDLALSLPRDEPNRLPSVRAMERAGMLYKDYDYALSLIEGKIVRASSGYRVKGGTVRELRDSM